MDIEEADPDLTLTIVVDSEGTLDSLRLQTIVDAELIATGEGPARRAAAGVAHIKEWLFREAESVHEAIEMARGEFLVGWMDVADAEDHALDSLVAAARANPNKRGAMAANFDPLILWRAEEFREGSSGRWGLAQASAKALVNGSGLHP